MNLIYFGRTVGRAWGYGQSGGLDGPSLGVRAGRLRRALTDAERWVLLRLRVAAQAAAALAHAHAARRVQKSPQDTAIDRSMMADSITDGTIAPPCVNLVLWLPSFSVSSGTSMAM